LAERKGNLELEAVKLRALEATIEKSLEERSAYENKTTKMAARVGRNPQTKEEIKTLYLRV
jgi:nucleoid DNA-binding protein